MPILVLSKAALMIRAGKPSMFRTIGISMKATAGCCMAIGMAMPGTVKPLQQPHKKKASGSFFILKA
ncbi:hypothetical protein D3C86_1048280 [compost metagenome]